jgi:hypothetical protein
MYAIHLTLEDPALEYSIVRILKHFIPFKLEVLFESSPYEERKHFFYFWNQQNFLINTTSKDSG